MRPCSSAAWPPCVHDPLIPCLRPPRLRLPCHLLRFVDRGPPLQPTCKLPGTESFPERLLRVCDSLNQIFADVLLNDLRVWPAYDLLCFSVVPPAHRPTATALVSVCWHTYMSLRASMSTSAHA